MSATKDELPPEPPVDDAPGGPPPPTPPMPRIPPRPLDWPPGEGRDFAETGTL